MYCYQCEQTAKGTGCTVAGVCGKDGKTAAMQDLLIHITKGIAQYAHRARTFGAQDRDVDQFVVEALFTTVTNVNFDSEKVAARILQGALIKDKAARMYEKAAVAAGAQPERLDGPAVWQPTSNIDGLLKQAEGISVACRREAAGPDITGLNELITYGLKGAAAYADHAQVLGVDDIEVYGFFHEALDYLTRPQEVSDLLAMALRVGEVNFKVMELLDRANTGVYGHPEPTQVRVTPIKGKAILVSGHDLKDLEELLKQTSGKGINVYTHGEMLPTLAYPGLKKYPHLVGNYGGAWQDQQREFNEFPGAILMTTNCIQRPKETYRRRIFTTGLVAFPEVIHVHRSDFSPVIEASLSEAGFTEDAAKEQFITVGFGRNAVLAVADKVIEAVKAGAIRHFFLVGGCDGAKPGRNYYTDFVQATPKDTVILTLACGKYRFNKLELGDIGGIPRLLDIGQCNDAYSAVQIALALANAFGVGVNDLPLSMVLSWYEQKAVAILLTLLHLGITNIRIGPSLPAFVTPAALQVLVDNFGLKPITTPEADLQAILGA